MYWIVTSERLLLSTVCIRCFINFRSVNEARVAAWGHLDLEIMCILLPLYYHSLYYFTKTEMKKILQH